ncbi:MAG: hemerythrin domain-containing protein [Alphaproteobacteria bacterium]
MAALDRRAAASMPDIGGIAPMRPADLADPLDFILGDHYRQRALCGQIERFAATPVLDRALGLDIVAFLSGDMAIHVIDEEQDLFPLLRRSCAPEDEIERVLAALSREHGDDERTAQGVCDAIVRLLGQDSDTIEPALREPLVAFARRQRRHLMVENSIVLPLARARLSAADRANLARRMASRRGWTPPRGRDAPAAPPPAGTEAAASFTPSLRRAPDRY